MTACGIVLAAGAGSRYGQPKIFARDAGGVLWLTGLPASGKSTLAMELEQRLFAKGYQVYVLDGENIRAGLSSDLGFSPKDRAEHNRRLGEMAANFAQAGFITIVAAISPN